MSFIFNKDNIIKIYIAKDERENVRLSVYDLKNDINRVCCDAEIVFDSKKADIIVCSANNEEFSRFSNCEYNFSREEYRYIVENEKIYLFGADDLGTMWAIDAFSEKELNIPPFYFFDGINFRRKKRIEIENKIVSDHPHTKFRGWFINDEDLLGGFRSKGKRDIDYAFYKDIIHPDFMEKIVETALRFKINLIIPSTLIDICNPYEEKLVKIVSKRGLFVSQHHIEPMGVSHFAFEKFATKFGYDKTQSFIQNKDAMVACWKYYAEKWAKYPRVVWQLGLRGAGDRPVWTTDKSVSDSERERGKLISDAIKTQYDIISSLTEKKIYSTSTVWMEGAKLLQSGDLKLPDETIAVFADIGMSQLFGDDFFSVPREKNRKYGIYNHSQYWHTGPHLSEGVYPEKIAYAYNLAGKYKSDYYTILNVGNVKEFTFSVNINAKLAWHGTSKSLSNVIDAYCSSYAQGYANEFRNMISEYFDALGELDEKYYKDFCNKYDFNYHKYENLPFPVLNINDGIVCFVGRCLSFDDKRKLYSEGFKRTVDNGYKKMQKVANRFSVLSEKIRKEYRKALIQKWYFQAKFWVNLFGFAIENCNAIEDYNKGNTYNISNYYLKSSEFVKNILDLRRELFLGKWKKWFSADTKLNIPMLYDFCINEYNRLK